MPADAWGRWRCPVPDLCAFVIPFSCLSIPACPSRQGCWHHFFVTEPALNELFDPISYRPFSPRVDRPRGRQAKVATAVTDAIGRVDA